MSHAHASEPFPRSALIGAAVLVGATLAVTAFVRLSGMDIRSLPDATPVRSRELVFTDLPDGAVRVVDARAGTVVTTLPPGTNGFVRATLRNLAHERRRSGIGAEPPFRVFASADGRLILEDPSIGRRIELEAFGPTNAGAFAHLLGDGND